MKLFSSIPFFRISLPFIIGILLTLNLDLKITEWFYLFLLLIPLTFLNFYDAGKRRLKWLFMLCADIFLLVLACLLVNLTDLRNRDNYYANHIVTDSVYTYVAIISDLPVEKEKFIKCEVSLMDLKVGAKYTQVSGQCLAYFKKSELSKKMKAGQLLLLRSRFSEIESPKNPLEFNYKNYLQNKQIYHTLFIDSLSVQFLSGAPKLNPLWNLGLRCKEFILKSLRNSNMSTEAFAICAALITGYDDEIDKTVMDAFAHSGTLHVLSVSGLHTGLIYLVLNFLFDFFDKRRKYKLSRFLIITILLWFFALITGFSAPVLRAVLMFNLLGAGNIFFRNHLKNQVNILFLSAFILLAYNPFFIMDIGFQLSYVAVFGLLYFQPKLQALWKTDNKVLNYFWQSVCVSFAATICTLPITLFYFKQFPLWFFLCNIVVVPATFILLILAALVILKLNLLAILINYLVRALTWLILLFNHEQSGYIDKIHFTKTDVFFLCAVGVLLSVFIELRRFKYLKISLIFLICWQCFSIFESYKAKQKRLLTVYQLKNTSAFSLKNKQHVYLNCNNNLAYNYSIKPQLISFNYPTIDSTRFNFIKTKSFSILSLNNKNLWPKGDLSDVNTLILSSNVILSEAELKAFPQLKRIVVDGSNNRYAATATEKLSRKFGIEYYNTKLRGAFLLPLP